MLLFLVYLAVLYKAMSVMLRIFQFAVWVFWSWLSIVSHKCDDRGLLWFSLQRSWLSFSLCTCHYLPFFRWRASL